MNNSLLIGKYIKKFITEDETLNALIKGQVYPLYTNQETKFPYIVYARTNTSVTYTKDGLTKDVITVSIVCVSDDYETSLTMANAVRKCFEWGTYKDETINIDMCVLANAVESSFDEGYLQTLTFNFEII